MKEPVRCRGTGQNDAHAKVVTTDAETTLQAFPRERLAGGYDSSHKYRLRSKEAKDSRNKDTSHTVLTVQWRKIIEKKNNKYKILPGEHP